MAICLSLSPPVTLALALSLAISKRFLSEELVLSGCWAEAWIPLAVFRSFCIPEVCDACRASSKASSVKPDDM